MELNAPQTFTCPICEEHETKLKENKSGKPCWTCRSDTCATTVNLHGDDAEAMLREKYLEIDDGESSDSSETLEQAEESDDDETTLQDLIEDSE